MRFLLYFLVFLTSPALAQLNADFSALSTQGCGPFTVQFEDKSSGSPSEWFWDFGNGTTSTLQNPSATYTENGNYTVRLIVRNSLGEALGEKNNFIKVLATPQVNFSITSGNSGCAPVISGFKDNSQLYNATVKSWLWNFGDGNTSTLQNPTHTFSAAGKYDVSLTIGTTEGCSATYTEIGGIGAGTIPVADFSAAPLSGCASKLRQFNNKSTGNITQSIWDFGDGGGSSEKHPLYHYQAPGTFNVKLIVSDNGCRDSIEKQNYIQVDAPVAKIGTVINCADRFTISFKDRSTGKGKRLWDFGDGQTATAAAVVHQYALPGVYIIKLAITGAICSDTARDTVYIQTSSPKVAIAPAGNSYCKYSSLQFFVADYDSIASRFFGWNFKDGTTLSFSGKGDSAIHAYKQNGAYKPEAYIKDYAGCIDTIPIITPVTIGGPIAGFDSMATGCTGAGTQFTNTSLEGNNVPINQWLWSYGDGSVATIQQPPNYTYSFPGVYNVSLKATDASGCTDSIMHAVEIFTTPVVDAGNDTLACAGSKITLKPTGALNYVWQNDPDLSCINCSNPVATPFQPAVYYVTGSSNGCSASDSIVVNVQTKELITVQPDAYSMCQGSSVTMNVTGTDSYSWMPTTTLSNSTIKNPVASPVSNTVYTVIGKDNNNCFTDTAIVNVTVNMPPTVNIADSIVELMTGTTYTILTSASNDVRSLEWSPGNGLSCYDCLQPVATVSTTTTYTVKASNEFGCTSNDSITIIAVCTDKFLYVPNTFSPNNDGMNDYFFPRSGAGITIKSLTIFNRWGQMVFQKKNFQTNNYTEGWDGKYKNVLQNADVYIYMMELECSGNKVFLKKGSISLLR